MSSQTSPIFVLIYLEDIDDITAATLDTAAGFFDSREAAESFVKAYNDSLPEQYQTYRREVEEFTARLNASYREDGYPETEPNLNSYERWLEYNERPYSVVPMERHTA